MIANSHYTLDKGLNKFVGDSSSGVFSLDFIFEEILPSKEKRVSVIMLSRTFPNRDVVYGSAFSPPKVFVVHLPGMQYRLTNLFLSFVCMASYSFVSKIWGSDSLLWSFLKEQCDSCGVVGFDVPRTRHLPLLTITNTELPAWGPGVYGPKWIQAFQPTGNFLKVR